MSVKPRILCPADSMSDEKISINILGLKAYQVHTIYACAVFDNGIKFESCAVFRSSNSGAINMATDHSLGGTYTGCDQMGIFWSMKASTQNKYPHARFSKSIVTTPLPVVIKVFDVELPTLEEINKTSVLELQSCTINRWFMAKKTLRIQLTPEKDGVLGTLFVPDGPGPYPGVIVMFGGQPGVIEHKASLLASHGFAAMTIAIFGNGDFGVPNYFSVDPLQLDYYQAAINRLLEEEKVSKNGVGVISVSFSACIALAMAECCEQVRCVVWISGFLRPGYRSIESKEREILPINFDLDMEKSVFRGQHTFRYIDGENTPGIMPDGFQFKFQNRFDVAYMFIAGLSDDNVPSEHHINYAEKLLKQTKHPNYQIYRYPGAGHLIEPPYAPLNKTTQFMNIMLVDWGGQPIPHCRSQEHSWKKQIQFLKANLVGSVGNKL